MEIVIVGCGKIGKSLLESLIKENHNITVIDSNEETVRTISNSYDVMAIVGNGTSYETLKSANVDKVDVFIATTSLDEVNLLSTFIAKTLGAKHTVARVRDEEHNLNNFEILRNKLGISMIINPELYTAKYLYNLINLPSATKVDSFSRRSFEIIELLIKEDSPIINIPLYELRKKYPYNFLICTVLRNDEVIIPDGFFSLKPGDKIGILSSFKETHKLLKLMGFEQKVIKDVLVVGASRIAVYLSQLLLEDKHPLTIIEKNQARALDIAETFHNLATVVLGDGMDQDLLLEHGAKNVDAFLSLTGKDEENILSSFYAKSHNASKIITEINKKEHLGVAENLGLDCLFSSQDIVADIIVSYVRALQSSMGSKIETLYSLMNGKAEAVEFTITSGFDLTNIPLKQLKLSPNMIIGGIIRNNKSIIPYGDDVIMPNDKIIIITKGQQVKDLSDVIKNR